MKISKLKEHIGPPYYYHENAINKNLWLQWSSVYKILLNMTIFGKSKQTLDVMF